MDELDQIVEQLLSVLEQFEQEQSKPTHFLQCGISDTALNVIEYVMKLEEKAKVEISDEIVEKISKISKNEGREQAKQTILEFLKKERKKFIL